MTSILYFIFFTLVTTITYAKTNLIEISTLKPPAPVKTTQGHVFVYEINLLNQDDQPVRIGRIEVLNENQQQLATYAGTKLKNHSFLYKNINGNFTKEGSHKFIELEKNMGAIVYLWVKAAKTTPQKLHHKIWTVTPSSDKHVFSENVLDYPVEVSQTPPAILGAPLKGGNWVATGALSPKSYHRRAILPIQGHFHLAQRYAIDWVQIHSDGKEAHGNLHKNNHWRAFGHPVLAVSDGIITKVHTSSAKENTPPGFPNPPPSLEESSGNYVILKIHQHNQDSYVLYAHMQPGSIRVKEGDTVKEGQVLGKLGNTGNSSQPHLHMQVMDANHALESEGVPYVFKKLEWIGKAGEIDPDYGSWKPFKVKKIMLKQMLPTENQAFQFKSGEN